MCIPEVSVERSLAGKKNAEDTVDAAVAMDLLPKDAMASRYEEVRGQVMRGYGGGIAAGQGLVLMRAKGLAGWLSAWRLAGDTPSARPARVIPAARKSADEQVTARIVSILATMALNNVQEPPHDSTR